MARKKSSSRPARKKRAKAPKTTGSRARRPSVAAVVTSAELETAAAAALTLPEALDSSWAGNLKDLLLAHRGTPIVVDAGQVRRTGMQAVQILISAAQTWKADGQNYVVTNPTQEFLDTIALAGLSREQLLVEGCL